MANTEITDDIRNWYPTMEMFFITIHNLFPEQVTSANLRSNMKDYNNKKLKWKLIGQPCNNNKKLRFKTMIHLHMTIWKKSSQLWCKKGMEWSEDSLTSSSTGSLASEVTFTDLHREADEEIASQEGRSSHLAAFQQVNNMLDFLDHASISSQMPATDSVPSSSQHQPSQAEQDYWNNWNTMEKYFNEDKNLPTAKRLRINEVGRNTEVAEGRDVIVIEPSVNFMDHPHRWFKG
ncbi:hypothetical protein C5167_036077 [Papaver somniferum]|nr:hypothetical protein C5167_036077 [Papaver somniferum]